MGTKVSVDQLASAVMRELDNYADTTTGGVKAAVKKAADTVKKEISATAPVGTGKYAKSWGTKSQDSFWSYYDCDSMMTQLRFFSNEEALKMLEELHAFD